MVFLAPVGVVEGLKPAKGRPLRANSMSTLFYAFIVLAIERRPCRTVLLDPPGSHTPRRHRGLSPVPTNACSSSCLVAPFRRGLEEVRDGKCGRRLEARWSRRGGLVPQGHHRRIVAHSSAIWRAISGPPGPGPAMVARMAGSRSILNPRPSALLDGFRHGPSPHLARRACEGLGWGPLSGEVPQPSWRASRSRCALWCSRFGASEP